MKYFENTSELKKFVKDNNLKDSNSNISFNAKIKIQTSRNHLETQTEVMIRFDGYNSAGKLTIMDQNGEVDPILFPGDVEAKFQNFKYCNNHFLEINGEHPKTNIGKYVVKIIPEN